MLNFNSDQLTILQNALAPAISLQIPVTIPAPAPTTVKNVRKVAENQLQFEFRVPLSVVWVGYCVLGVAYTFCYLMQVQPYGLSPFLTSLLVIHVCSTKKMSAVLLTIILVATLPFVFYRGKDDAVGLWIVGMSFLFTLHARSQTRGISLLASGCCVAIWVLTCMNPRLPSRIKVAGMVAPLAIGCISAGADQLGGEIRVRIQTVT
jgi:hypothetical protein